MLDEQKILTIARQVATANLTSASVINVISEPTIDSEGHEALRITIVIPPGAAASLGGDAALDTLTQIQDRLQTAGEDRFPIVEYATEDELQSSVDS
jgi:hypothetical protein